MLDELRIQVGESRELRLIQVHHEELVRGRQVGLLGRELFVEVVDVLAMFLKVTKREKGASDGIHRDGERGGCMDLDGCEIGRYEMWMS